MPQPTTRARTTGHPGYSQTLPRVPKSAASARRLVHVALAVRGMDDLAEDGALIISELVSNAVRSAGVHPGRRRPPRSGVRAYRSRGLFAGAADAPRARRRARARSAAGGSAGRGLGHRPAAVGETGVGGAAREGPLMSTRAVARHETWTPEPDREPAAGPPRASTRAPRPPGQDVLRHATGPGVRPARRACIVQADPPQRVLGLVRGRRRPSTGRRPRRRHPAERRPAGCGPVTAAHGRPQPPAVGPIPPPSGSEEDV